MRVIREICEFEGVSHENGAYVGDSLTRDMLMSIDAGLFSIWAKYGASADRELYDKLVRISHWTPEEVAREASLKHRTSNIAPDFVADRDFFQVGAALGIKLEEFS